MPSTRMHALQCKEVQIDAEWRQLDGTGVVKELERCSSLMTTCVLQILTRADLGRAEMWSNGFGPVVRF